MEDTRQLMIDFAALDLPSVEAGERWQLISGGRVRAVGAGLRYVAEFASQREAMLVVRLVNAYLAEREAGNVTTCAVCGVDPCMCPELQGFDNYGKLGA